MLFHSITRNCSFETALSSSLILLGLVVSKDSGPAQYVQQETVKFELEGNEVKLSSWTNQPSLSNESMHTAPPSLSSTSDAKNVTATVVAGTKRSMVPPTNIQNTQPEKVAFTSHIDRQNNTTSTNSKNITNNVTLNSPTKKNNGGDPRGNPLVASVPSSFDSRNENQKIVTTSSGRSTIFTAGERLTTEENTNFIKKGTPTQKYDVLSQTKSNSQISNSTSEKNTTDNNEKKGNLSAASTALKVAKFCAANGMESLTILRGKDCARKLMPFLFEDLEGHSEFMHLLRELINEKKSKDSMASSSSAGQASPNSTTSAGQGRVGQSRLLPRRSDVNKNG